MANSNAPFGMRPSRKLGSPGVLTNWYAHASSDSNALYIGDVVVTNHTSTSGFGPDVPDGTPYCTLISDNSGAGTTADVRGVVIGVRPNYTNLTLQYCPASTAMAIQVCDDPLQLFEVMSDGTLATSSIGATAKYINNTSGASTYTGMSGGELHQSTVGQSHYTLHIIRMAPIIGNVMGANSVAEVKINNHELLDTSGDV